MGSTFVRLTGGLGNQLFQLTAGLHLADSSNVFLLPDEDGIRCFIPGIPDIQGFNLTPQVSVADLNVLGTNIVLKRSLQFAMSSALSNTGLRQMGIARWMSNQAATLAASVYAKKFTPVHTSTVLGWDDDLTSRTGNLFLNGYFQSSKYISIARFRDQIQITKPIYDFSWYQKMEKLAAVENPIVLHLRLGDYREASGFGIPSLSYYENGLAALESMKNDCRIWIFSDEPNAIWDFLPRSVQRFDPRIIDSVANNPHPATALAVMALGNHFVIGNSTFALWASFLSAHLGKLVICPDPWFESIDDPCWLIPENYLRLPR